VPYNVANVHFVIPARDADGDRLTYRLARPEEMGDSVLTHPPALSIDSDGTLHFNTQAAAGDKRIGDLWCTQIVISDPRGASTSVDFILHILNVTGTPPAMLINGSSMPQSFSVATGTALSFNLQGTDADKDPLGNPSLVTLSVSGAPATARLAPAFPVSGAGSVTSTFTWTPTDREVGSYTITFAAMDATGLQTLNAANIVVQKKIDPLKIVTSELPPAKAGERYSATIDAVGGATPYVWRDVDWPADAGLHLDASTGTITGTAGKPGTYKLKVRLSDGSSSPATEQTIDITIADAGKSQAGPSSGGKSDAQGPPGSLKLGGGPETLDVDLGAIVPGRAGCHALDLPGEFKGTVPFTFRLLRDLPSWHTLEMRSGDRAYRPGQPPLPMSSGQHVDLCLDTHQWTSPSMASGETWLELMALSNGQTIDVSAVQVHWRVVPLTFWERWGRWLLLLAAALIVAFIIYGYVKPQRFPRGFAMTFVSEYADLDQTAEPLSQWSDVGIGWYKDARAFLRPDFRVSGRKAGALGVLRAARRNEVFVAPVGATLYREIDPGEWEEVAPQGRRARPSTAYRFGDRGPYFQISTSWRR